MSPNPDSETIKKVRPTHRNPKKLLTGCIENFKSLPSKNATIPTLTWIIIKGFIFHHMGPLITRSEIGGRFRRNYCIVYSYDGVNKWKTIPAIEMTSVRSPSLFLSSMRHVFWKSVI